MKTYMLSHIEAINKRLSKLRKSSAEDRARLHMDESKNFEWNDEGEWQFSLIIGTSNVDEIPQSASTIGEIQYFAMFVQGFSDRVSKAKKRTISEMEEWINQLKNYNIFFFFFVNEWHKNVEGYDNLKLYVECIDYLRLILINYISNLVELEKSN